MPANRPLEERDLIEAAVAWLRANLPGSWKIDSTSQTFASQDPTRPSRVIDALVSLNAPQGLGTNLLVEAKSTFTPRDAERFQFGLARQLRLLNSGYPILVVAPWLSERAQEVLAADEINYLDLTGNARIALSNPPLFIRSKGASRNPSPAPAEQLASRDRRRGALSALSSMSILHTESVRSP